MPILLYFISNTCKHEECRFPLFSTTRVKFGYRPYQIWCSKHTIWFLNLFGDQWAWIICKCLWHHSFAFQGWLNYSSGKIQTIQICDDTEGFPFKSALFGLGQYHDYCLRWNFWHCKQTHWLWLRFVPTVDNGKTCRLLPTVTIRTLQLQVVQTWHAGICELLIWITPRLAIVPIGIWSPLGNEHDSPLAWSSDLVSV